MSKDEGSQREPAFFIDPILPGSEEPETSERRTFADHLAAIVRVGEFLHEQHGAVRMTRRAALKYAVNQYRQTDGVDIDDFWRLRPDLKPVDFDEKRDVCMDGHPAHWAKLARDKPARD
jgi:hypothetical protein